jgi:hypothetical protein
MNFFSENMPTLEEHRDQQAQVQKEIIRQTIAEQAGDQQTILGTTTDATQLLLYALCTITVKLNKANSLAEVREATATIEPMATAFLAKIESGEVKLPFMQKGLDSVVNDIQTRATAVAGVLGRIAKQNEADNPS